MTLVQRHKNVDATSRRFTDVHLTLYKRHVLLGFVLFVCVEVLRPSQPSGVMSSAVSLPDHTFTGQA